MARKVASYKKIRPPRVKLGRNQDAGFAIRVAVTDTRADIYQPYQHPKADQKVTIGFRTPKKSRAVASGNNSFSKTLPA